MCYTINKFDCASWEEHFWPEDSRAPANALRRMLYKARDLLKEMYSEQKERLLTLPGCYTWNPEAVLELDTEQFEAACLEARRKEGEEKTETLLAAVPCIRGTSSLPTAADGCWGFASITGLSIWTPAKSFFLCWKKGECGWRY